MHRLYVRALTILQVMKIVVAAFVPTCGELLWSDLFCFANEWFCFLALFESILVISLTFCEYETLLPPWLSSLVRCTTREKVTLVI